MCFKEIYKLWHHFLKNVHPKFWDVVRYSIIHKKIRRYDKQIRGISLICVTDTISLKYLFTNHLISLSRLTFNIHHDRSFNIWVILNTRTTPILPCSLLRYCHSQIRQLAHSLLNTKKYILIYL